MGDDMMDKTQIDLGVDEAPPLAEVFKLLRYLGDDVLADLGDGDEIGRASCRERVYVLV